MSTMQTAKTLQSERVTYLTSAEQKAALEAFAKARGESVGNVLREAAMRYMAQPRDETEEEAELAALVQQVNEALPKMNEAIDQMIDDLRVTHEQVDRTLRAAGIRK
jgi:hypothetical protein